MRKAFQLFQHLMMQNSYRAYQRVKCFPAFISISHIKGSSVRTSSSDESAKDSENIYSGEENDFNEKLVKWAVQNNISYLSFSKLLKVLSEHGVKHLPKSSRELLLAREEGTEVFVVPPGSYTHFGLDKSLKILISKLLDNNLFTGTDIKISIFIDHLPLSKFSKRGLWVILGSLSDFKPTVFLVGAYLGFSRPNSSNLFLSKFVDEVKHLYKNGLEIKNVIYNLNIARLICDAPAKQFVLNFKSFTGYSSCTKCDSEGETNGRKICFLEKGNPRTDEDFENNELYKLKKTILLEIPNFGVVSKIPLDYMHLVCLGVVHKLVTLWATDEKYWIYMNAASSQMKMLAKIFPCEFAKKPKPFKMHGFWSPNELRQFLLYYGPVILKDNLEKQYYNHFLLLHVACRLLCTDVSIQNIDLGKKLLNSFVEDYKKLYKEFITHNFHGLYHLADECASHGTLDSFSAFPYEKFLTKLKNIMCKSRKKTIPQTMLRESYEKIFAQSLTKLSKNNFEVSKKLKTCDVNKFNDYSHYERLTFKSCTIIPSSEGDNCVLLKNKKLIQVVNILQKVEKSKRTTFIAGKEFSSVCNFLSQPYESLQLGMFRVGEVSDSINIWPVDMIDRKCMKIPDEKEETVMVTLFDENF